MASLMSIPLGIRPLFVFMKSPFKTLLVAGGLFAGISSQAQILITKWDFNAANLQPSIGSGTISLIEGTTATFAGGIR